MIFSGSDLDVVPIILVIDIVDVGYTTDSTDVGYTTDSTDVGCTTDSTDVGYTTDSTDVVLTYNVVSIAYCVLALYCLNQCICTLYGDLGIKILHGQEKQLE